MLRKKARTAFIAVAIAGVAALAACGSGGSSGSAAAAPKVLKVWWYEGPGSAYQIAWDQAIKDFKQEHPGVTVQFSLKSFNQMQQSASMILNSTDVPDVMEYNKGDATTGLLSKQGLLTDFTPEVTKYGWDKLLGPGLQVTAKYDAKGVMGSGNWYGVSDYAEYLTVYYNKALFAKYGVQVPTTMAQLTAAMDTFVKAGVTPLANAGNDYMAQQYLYELELSKATPAATCSNYERYTGSVELPRRGLDQRRRAPSRTGSSKGYIAKNSVSLTATQAGNDFETGKNPMMVSGSWWCGTFESEIKNFTLGHVPVARQHAERRLGRQPVRGAEERREQAARLRLHQRHAEARRAEAACQQRRGAGLGQHRRRHRPAQRPADPELPDRWRTATGWPTTPTGRPPASTTRCWRRPRT